MFQAIWVYVFVFCHCLITFFILLRIHLESHDRRAYSAASAAAALDVYDTWRFNNAYRDKVDTSLCSSLLRNL